MKNILKILAIYTFGFFITLILYFALGGDFVRGPDLGAALTIAIFVGFIAAHMYES